MNAGNMASIRIATEEIHNVDERQLRTIGTYIKTSEDSGNNCLKKCTNDIKTKHTCERVDNKTIEERLDENDLDKKSIDDVLKYKTQMLYNAYGFYNSDVIYNVYDALDDPKQSDYVRNSEKTISHDENHENTEHHNALGFQVQTDSIKSFRTMFKCILPKRILKSKSFSSDTTNQPTSQENIVNLTVLKNTHPNGTHQSSCPIGPCEHLRSNSYIFVGEKEIELMAAAEDGDANEVRRLLSRGANLNAKDSDYLTALHWAVERGNFEVGSILLEAGADVNDKDAFGCTPLHYTAAFGDVQFAAMLIKYGADVNCRNKNGYTALMGAMRNGNDAVVRLLLIAGATS